MSAAATIVTDGSPEALALSRWIRENAPGLSQMDALDATDVPRVTRARLSGNERERLVVLAPGPREGADIDGSRALAVVRTWLAGLAPIDARMRGAMTIAERTRRGDTGASDVLALLRRITPTKIAATVPKKRGRPKGDSNPFRGAGFDVCVALLREPARTFTERALAEAAGRSHYAVHRIVLELDGRGYLDRDEGGTRLARRAALRDDLALSWSTRVGAPRAARYFAPPARRDPLDAVLDATREAGIEPVLAGPSALPPGRGLVGAPLTFYAPDQAAAALEAAGFRALRTSAGTVRLWPVLERAVVAHAVRLEGHGATHPVITYLDLVVSTDEREKELARGLESRW